MLPASVLLVLWAYFLRCAGGTPGVADSLGDMMGRMSAQMVPNTTESDAAAEVMKGLASIPAPGKVLANRIDPLSPGEDSCDRDRKQMCPEEWVSVGPVKGGSTEYCHAGTQYFGPCRDELQSFKHMSISATKRWSRDCLAYFPCNSCAREYGKVCPAGWEKQGDEQRCKPPPDYNGPCRGGANFAGYSANMLEAWAELCSAYWPCRAAPSQDFISADPISKDATMSRIARGLQ